MNAPDAVNLALAALNARLLDADTIGRALDMAAGDSPQPWVTLFCDQLEGVAQAASDLECTVRGGSPHD